MSTPRAPADYGIEDGSDDLRATFDEEFGRGDGPDPSATASCDTLDCRTISLRRCP